MVALRAALIALLVAGCYSPAIEECTIACGAGGACPADTTCGVDNYCHGDLTFSCLDKPDGSIGIDGRLVDAGPDGRLPDAGPDARLPDAGPDARLPDAGPDGRPDGPLPPDARLFDARLPDAALPDAPPAPPCTTDELTAIEETDAEDATHSNLSVAPDGHVHVTYIDLNTGNLRYAHRAPKETAWHFETIGPAGVQLKGQALGSDGTLHVAYTTAGTLPHLDHAWREPNADGWKTESIDESAIGLDASVAVDGSVVHVVYWYNRTDLRYAVQRSRGGEWAIAPIATEGTVGEFPSIDLGPDGTLHVSYRIGLAASGTSQDLAYATLPPGASSWSTARIDTPGNVGLYTSLAVDGTGNVHIAYQDAANEELKYALLPTSGQRRTGFADETFQVGRFNSIGVDAAGTVYIAYYDYGRGDLKLAVRHAAQTAFTADTLAGDTFNEDVGSFASLGIDGFGQVHIAYIDEDFGDLRYAHICPR